MKRIALAFLMLTTWTLALAQAPKPAEVVAKSSPASDALVQFARDRTVDQKTFNDKFQQARSVLDSTNKTLNDQMQAIQKDLQAKLQADKKYKPMLDQIADIQKKMNDAGATAQAAFQKDIGPIQQKVQMESNEIQGLIPVVRKENGFPDTANFDMDTQKWIVPEKK